MALGFAALLVGIGELLFGLVPVFGALVGIIAVVFGILALRKQQSKGMAVTGTSSEVSRMSKAGIYDHVTSEYRDQFALEAAQYAVHTLQADSGANALEKAKTYRQSMSMFLAAIREQFVSPYGEKFTAAEADANLNG